MVCPHCGHETHSGRIYCPECGGRLTPLEEARRPKRSGGGPKRALALVVAVVVLAGGFLAYRQFSGGPGPVQPVQLQPTPTPEPGVETAPIAAATDAPVAAPTEAPTTPPVSGISTRDELAEALKGLTVSGGTRLEGVDLPETTIQELLDDFGYYYSSLTYTYDNLFGPRDYTFELAPSRRAWYAWRDGRTAGLDAEAASLLARAQGVIDQVITPGMTDYEKELALHDYIIDHCEYMIDVENRNTADIRGFFDYGMCQCAGYCDTFWLLGSMAGLEVSIIFGDALKVDPDLARRYNIETSGHSWNLIRLDGLWYGLDLTWDDPVGDVPTRAYTYFNMPTAYLRDDRVWKDWQDPDGAYAQAIDDNYYLYRQYNHPDYLAGNRDQAFQAAVRQIDTGATAIVALTDKVNAESIVQSVSSDLASHYGDTSWYSGVLYSESPGAAYMPFYVYKFSIGREPD